jgi:hypothetical protein
LIKYNSKEVEPLTVAQPFDFKQVLCFNIVGTGVLDGPKTNENRQRNTAGDEPPPYERIAEIP